MKYEEYQDVTIMLEQLPKQILDGKTKYEHEDKTITLYNDGTVFTKNMIENLELDKLASFNLPTSYIIDNDKVMGSEEKKIDFHEFDITDIDTVKLFKNLNNIKEDISLLSSNNLLLKNISFTYNNEEIILTNILDSLEISNLDYDSLYSLNINTMNKFLIGLIIYDLYQNKKTASEENLSKVDKYNDTYCKNKFFGDVLKEMFSIEETEIKEKNK